MADVFEKAWGNFLAMFEFLSNPDGDEGGFNDQKGLIQLFNFATLVPYSANAKFYNDFLLQNAINYAAPGVAVVDTTSQLATESRLEHVTDLVSSYSYFLDQLDSLLEGAVDPTDLPQYKSYDDAVTRAQTSQTDYQSYVDGRWSDWVANNPGFPTDQLSGQRIVWERERGHSSKLDTLKRSVSLANVRRNAWLRGKIPADLHALIDARTYLDDPGYKIKLPVSPNHENRREYWRDNPMQLPLFSLDDFLINDDQITYRFSTRDSHYSRVETKWKAKVKGRWGIFSGGGSAERRRMEEVSTRSEFTCEISFAKFMEVEVFRDKWFQPILFDTIGKNFKEFWGSGGLLATYPVSLFVCRGMKVSVTIDDEYKRTLEQFFAAGGSASFGPFFSGGGSYSRDEKYMDFKATSQGFELIDNPKTVRLLGCRVRRPNWSDAQVTEYLEGLTASRLAPLIQYMETLATTT